MPLTFTDAPITTAPGDLATGMLSPVTMDSSTSESPAWTRPSTGIFDPGFAPPRAPISNQCPSSTNAVSTVAAS